VIRYVLEQQPMLPSRIQAAISPLDLIHTEAKEILNEKAQGKTAPKATKAAPAKTAAKGHAKSKTMKKAKARK